MVERINDENDTNESASRVSISRSTQLVKQQNDGGAPKGVKAVKNTLISSLLKIDTYLGLVSQIR
jgi:hypothetical protein